MDVAAEIAQTDVTRAGLRLHLAANTFDADTTGAGVRLHDRVRRDGHFIADGDVPLHVFRQVVADADAVAALLNRGIGLDLVDWHLGVAEPSLLL